MNPKLCPLCQKQNLCAISAGKPAEQCWCMEELKVPVSDTPRVLLPIPETATACYCQSCLEQIKKKQQTGPSSS
ncbi:cysteine-rich CWC family protein [Endozoicomonas arenosclerae]|uniref:cysteine-rich CWC family protein n=1 Tax=Endozoicomonas arenosclerae TaxID=1633495 RepID=UPI0009A22E89